MKTMNHSFWSCRGSLGSLQKTITLCNDMTLILRCSPQERSLICKRCEADVTKNEALVLALERQGFNLGNKMKTLVANMLELGVKHDQITISDYDMWTAFCTSTNKVDSTKLITTISKLLTLVELKRLDLLGKEMAGTTDIDASSSYSDYTDSDTESSDDEEKSRNTRDPRVDTHNTTDEDESGSEDDDDGTTYTSSAATSSGTK